jgi:hypothetical protein
MPMPPESDVFAMLESAMVARTNTSQSRIAKAAI